MTSNVFSRRKTWNSLQQHRWCGQSTWRRLRFNVQCGQFQQSAFSFIIHVWSEHSWRVVSELVFMYLVICVLKYFFSIANLCLTMEICIHSYNHILMLSLVIFILFLMHHFQSYWQVPKASQWLRDIYTLFTNFVSFLFFSMSQICTKINMENFSSFSENWSTFDNHRYHC